MGNEIARAGLALMIAGCLIAWSIHALGANHLKGMRIAAVAEQCGTDVACIETLSAALKEAE